MNKIRMPIDMPISALFWKLYLATLGGTGLGIIGYGLLWWFANTHRPTDEIGPFMYVFGDPVDPFGRGLFLVCIALCVYGIHMLITSLLEQEQDETQAS